MISKKGTKQYKVERYFIQNGKITSIEAIERFKATRLSAIIYRLKKSGYVIDTEMVYKTNANGERENFAIYHLLNREEILKKEQENGEF